MPELTPQLEVNAVLIALSSTVVLALLWVVIRSAVLEALRAHQKELDKRASAHKPYVPLTQRGSTSE